MTTIPKQINGKIFLGHLKHQGKVLSFTGWNDKIIVLKKTIQLYFKTFMKISIQVT